MPNFDNPVADSRHAQEALAASHTPPAVDRRPGHLLGPRLAVRRGGVAEQSCTSSATFHDGPARAHSSVAGDYRAGSRSRPTRSSWELHRAAEILRQVAEPSTTPTSRGRPSPTPLRDCPRPAAPPDPPTGAVAVTDRDETPAQRRSSCPPAASGAVTAEPGGPRHRVAGPGPGDPRRAAAKAKAEDSRPSDARPSSSPGSGNPVPPRCVRRGGCGSAATRTPPRRWRAPTRSSPRAGSAATGCSSGRTSTRGSSFVYDPWVLYARGLITAPNVVLAGIVGSGKSALAKSLYTRSIPFGRRVYVPGDPKGEHTAVAEAVGGRAIALGHGMATRLNPLDEGHRPAGFDDAQWRGAGRPRAAATCSARWPRPCSTGGSPRWSTPRSTSRWAARSGRPTCRCLPMVVDRLLAPDTTDDPDGRLAEDGRLVGHALRRLVAGDLAGLFDGPSTVRFDPTLPMVSLDLSRVTENATLISVLMTCASAWMESALLDPARRAAVGRVRRGVAADVPPRSVAPDGCALAAGPALRDREHADLPQALRPRQRRRPRLRDAGPRVVAAGERRDPRSSTGRNPTSSAPPRPRSGSPAPNSPAADARAPGRGCGGSSTAPSSSSTSCTRPSSSSSTRPHEWSAPIRDRTRLRLQLEPDGTRRLEELLWTDAAPSLGGWPDPGSRRSDPIRRAEHQISVEPPTMTRARSAGERGCPYQEGGPCRVQLGVRVGHRCRPSRVSHERDVGWV